MAGRALILSEEQEAKVRQDIVDSAHRTFDARSYGVRNFPVFLEECIEKRVWEQERRFESGTRQEPISFEEFIRRPYPVGLGATFESVERIIRGNPKLESAWLEITGREIRDPEPNDMDECERVIGDGLRTFVEVGRALTKIRDSGWYKGAGYRTFEVYCQERWNLKRRRAYELIEAASVVVNLPQESAPTVESHAAQIARLPSDEQAEAWQEARETAPDGKVTARHVADVVDARLNPEPEGDTSEPQSPTPAEPLPRVVKLGPVDRAMGIVRNMSETEVYEFKNRFQEYLRERALGDASK